MKPRRRACDNQTSPAAPHSVKLYPLLNPVAPFRSLWRQRDLLRQMTDRDTRSRYRGAAMGLFWSAINPLLMLTIYTFFFSEVFQAKWPGATQDRSQFALSLYIGLLLHGFFSECIVRAPTLVIANQNLVKKVSVPVGDTCSQLGSAIFHFSIGLVIWFAFELFVDGLPPATAILLPLIVAPLAVAALGFSWMLASLGVYVRDIAHLTPVIATVLMFASPVFYPSHALPEQFHIALAASPLTVPIEEARAVLLAGRAPDWVSLGAYTMFALAIAVLGFAWFQGTRKGFADVV